MRRADVAAQCTPLERLGFSFELGERQVDNDHRRTSSFEMVAAAIARYHEMGIRSVPVLVLDGRYVLQGLPDEALLQPSR